MSKKPIQINDITWKWLNQVKLDFNFRSVDDVIELMKIHTEDSIKKGNFEFTKQK